jgi:hypothetical protein
VTYGRRLGEMLALLSDSMSGTLSESDALRGPFGAPLGLLFLALTLAGLVSAARRRAWLPALAVLGYCALLPVVNARFEPSVPKARYIAPLFPLCYSAISLLAVEALRRADRGGLLHVHTVLRLARVLVVVGIAGLSIAPLAGLQTYYRQEAARGRTNADLYAAIGAVNAARRPDDQILVDRALQQAYTSGGGQMYEHLRFAASVYGWNRLPVDLPMSPDDPRLRKAGVLVLANSDVELAQTTIHLEPVDAGPVKGGHARVFRVLGPVRP